MNATPKNNTREEKDAISSVNTQGTFNKGDSHQVRGVKVGVFARLRSPSFWAALALFGSLGATQAAQSVSLAWNTDPDPTVTGYNVIYGTSTGNLNQTANQGNSTVATISNLTAGQTYYFSAVAYNAQGFKSLPSNQVSFAATPTPTPTPVPTPIPTPVPTPTPTPKPTPTPTPVPTPTPTPVPTPTPTPKPTPTPTPVPTPTPTPTPTGTPYPAVSLFSTTDTPKSVTQTWNDGTSLELGVKFQSTKAGTITGIRFYKTPSNTSPHIGNLWSATGTLLASITSKGETASGWQQINFTTPVAVAAGTTYVASYHTTLYSCDVSYFTSAVTKGPLTASAGSNGVYVYASSNSFPSGSYQSSNYWVDVAFQPTVTTVAATAPVLDAKVSQDQGTTNAIVSTPAFSTAAANELLVACISTDYLLGANTTVTKVTGAGLTWALVQRTNVQAGTSEIWRAFAPAALNSVSVSATLSQSVNSSITVVSYKGVNSSGTNGSGAIGAIGTGNGVGAPSVSLTTTQNNSLVVAVGNDFDNAIGRTTPSGQGLLHQDFSPVGDTYWVQTLTSPAAYKGTAVNINDTAPTGDRYNLSAVEVLAAPLTP